MHTNVHCSTVYNSKDLESTQMPIDDRLDRENVAHIQHGILCSNQKRWVRVLCRDMDEAESHHSQQTDTRIENQTLHVLTHKWELNNKNIWTQGEEHHTTGPVREWRARGGKALGPIPNVCLKPRWWVDRCSKPPWHMYICVTNLYILYMYPRT